MDTDTELQQKALYDRDVVSDIFLDNLKTSTPWIIKAVNIKLLVDQIDHGKYEHILHIAAHLSNLIKVSEHVVVRHDAGNALLRIIELLTPDQRNEIVGRAGEGPGSWRVRIFQIYSAAIWEKWHCGCRRNSWTRYLFI